MSETLDALMELAAADQEAFGRALLPIQKTLDNGATWGQIEPLVVAVVASWVQDAIKRADRMEGTRKTREEAERVHGIYQGLADLLIASHSTKWKPSKHALAKEVRKLIIAAGYGEKSTETIRKNITIPSK